MDTYDRIELLLKENHQKQSDLAKATGISTGLISQWKNRSQEPSSKKLSLVADFFHVTVDYLIGNVSEPFFYLDNERILKEINSYGDEDDEKTPALTKKDERDIARDLENLRDVLEDEETLMFDGNPMTPEARESILAAMKLGLEAAKVKNKEKYTPKKYKGTDVG